MMSNFIAAAQAIAALATVATLAWAIFAFWRSYRDSRVERFRDNLANVRNAVEEGITSWEPLLIDTSRKIAFSEDMNMRQVIVEVQECLGTLSKLKETSAKEEEIQELVQDRVSTVLNVHRQIVEQKANFAILNAMSRDDLALMTIFQLRTRSSLEFISGFMPILHAFIVRILQIVQDRYSVEYYPRTIAKYVSQCVDFAYERDIDPKNEEGLRALIQELLMSARNHWSNAHAIPELLLACNELFVEYVDIYAGKSDSVIWKLHLQEISKDPSILDKEDLASHLETIASWRIAKKDHKKFGEITKAITTLNSIYLSQSQEM